MTYTQQQQPAANNGMTVEQPEPAHVSAGTKPGDIEMAQPGVAQPMGMFLSSLQPLLYFALYSLRAVPSLHLSLATFALPILLQATTTQRKIKNIVLTEVDYYRPHAPPRRLNHRPPRR